MNRNYLAIAAAGLVLASPALAQTPGEPAAVDSAAYSAALLGATTEPSSGALEAADLAAYEADLAQRRAGVDEGAFDQVFRHGSFTVTDGTRIHYVTGGEGPPLVLIHGWTQTWRAWRQVMPALAQHYTIIAPDLRGLGDSDKPLDGYDGLTVADDIHQVVQGLGHTGPIDLVGHDLGGPTAYAYAASHPHEVRRLVILEGMPAGLEPSPEEGAAPPSTPPIFHANLHQIADLPELLIEGQEREYLAYFFRAFSYDGVTFSEEEIDAFARTYAEKGGLRGGFAHYRALPESAAQNRELAQTKLTMPVLAIGGEVSYGPVMAASARLFAEDVTEVILPRTGHFIPDERPATFTRLLLEFFGRTES